MVLFDRLHTSLYLSSIVTMAIYCIVSETKRNIGPKTPICHTAFHLTCTITQNPCDTTYSASLCHDTVSVRLFGCLSVTFSNSNSNIGICIALPTGKTGLVYFIETYPLLPVAYSNFYDTRIVYAA